MSRYNISIKVKFGVMTFRKNSNCNDFTREYFFTKPVAKEI